MTTDCLLLQLGASTRLDCCLIMIGNQRLLLTASFCLSLVCCQIAFGSSHPTRVTRSAIEHLQDCGTYIIYVNNTVSEAELQHFAAVLEEQFIAEIVERFFIIHCLTAKLSNSALQWVRIKSVNTILCYNLLESYMVTTVYTT